MTHVLKLIKKVHHVSVTEEGMKKLSSVTSYLLCRCLNNTITSYLE